MKTHNYNPSVYEVKLATAILSCQEQIQNSLGQDLKIVETEDRMDRDNPMVIFHLQDKDGDQHEVVIKVIQRPDQI